VSKYWIGDKSSLCLWVVLGLSVMYSLTEILVIFGIVSKRGTLQSKA
jgi:hypothetical protein